MKYPIHRAKGPKHISVNSLDTGSILGGDWRSAEKEARFVENWGRAGRWTSSEVDQGRRDAYLKRGMPKDTEERYAERDLEAEQVAAEAERKMVEGSVRVPDVNAMSKKEFKRYIATVRRERGQFLATKLEGAKDVENDSKPTLIGLATRGLASTHDPLHFQSNLTHQEMGSTESDQIHSTPHNMYGLAYASSSSSSTPVKGRVLNQVPNRGRFGAGVLDSNSPWVASVGGVTAELSKSDRAIRDSSLTPTDYSRSDRQAGEYTFTIEQARLESPPTVQYLAQSQRAAQWDNRGVNGRPIRQSGAAQPSPLDTAGFTIRLKDHANDALESEPGSKEWVAKEPRRTSYFSPEDNLGRVASILGTPKSGREQGSTLKALGDMREREEQKAQDRRAREGNKNVTTNLINRLRHIREDQAAAKA